MVARSARQPYVVTCAHIFPCAARIARNPPRGERGGHSCVGRTPGILHQAVFGLQSFPWYQLFSAGQLFIGTPSALAVVAHAGRSSEPPMTSIRAFPNAQSCRRAAQTRRTATACTLQSSIVAEAEAVHWSAPRSCPPGIQKPSAPESARWPRRTICGQLRILASAALRQLTTCPNGTATQIVNFAQLGTSRKSPPHA